MAEPCPRESQDMRYATLFTCPIPVSEVRLPQFTPLVLHGRLKVSRAFARNAHRRTRWISNVLTPQTKPDT